MASKSQTSPRPYDFIASDMDGTLLRPSHLLSPLTLQTLKTLVTRHGTTLILATGRNYQDVQAVNTRLQEYFALPEDDNNDAHCARDGHGNDRDAPVADAAPSSRRPPTYLITSNGAVVHDARTRQVVCARYLDAAVARQLYWLLPSTETEINTHAYQHDGWWCRHDWPDILAYHKISGIRYTLCAQACDNDDDATTRTQARQGNIGCGCYEGVSKLFYDCKDASRRDEVVSRVRALFDEQTVAVTFSGPHFVEVMAANVNKGSALCSVLRMLASASHNDAHPRHDQEGAHGHDSDNNDDNKQSSSDEDDATLAQCLRRTIAFGDELNDVEMLRMCGQGCLMGNGNPKVKECCPHVECIASNADDGMARKLCSVFGLDHEALEAKGKTAMQRLDTASS